jgi:hypothetical protein
MVPALTRAPEALLLMSSLALLSAGGPGAARAASEDESLRGPDVTIIAAEKRTIYEFRQNGELRMVRVVPTVGKPYHLVPRDPTRGYGDLERADMLLPSWTIVEF